MRGWNWTTLKVLVLSKGLILNFKFIVFMTPPFLLFTETFPKSEKVGEGAASSVIIIMSFLKTCPPSPPSFLPTAQRSALHMRNIHAKGIIRYYSANNNTRALLMYNYQSMTEVMGNKHMKVRHSGGHRKIQTDTKAKSSMAARMALRRGVRREATGAQLSPPKWNRTLKPSRVAGTNTEASPMG